MTKINLSVILAAALLLGGTMTAVAGPTCVGTTCTITNQTAVEAYSTQGGGAVQYGGVYWGSAGIGSSIYDTPQATISFNASTDSVNIVFQTGLYNGLDTTFSPTLVHAADIFLNDLSAPGATSNGGLPGSTGNTFYNYGISLGLDTADGGETQKGLYALGTAPTEGKSGTGEYLTSQDVWNNKGNFDYGGAYGTTACDTTSTEKNSQTCTTSAPAPTVVTGGTLMTGITVTTTCTSDNGPVVCGSGTPDGNLGTLEVSLQANNGLGTPTDDLATNLAFLEGLFQNYDIFWGTGDCSNAPIWGQVSQLNKVPEPSSLALFATAAMGWRMMRRRKRKAPEVG